MMNKTELDYAAMGILFKNAGLIQFSIALGSVIFTISSFKVFHSNSFCSDCDKVIPSWLLTSHCINEVTFKELAGYGF